MQRMHIRKFRIQTHMQELQRNKRTRNKGIMEARRLVRDLYPNWYHCSSETLIQVMSILRILQFRIQILMQELRCSKGILSRHGNTSIAIQSSCRNGSGTHHFPLRAWATGRLVNHDQLNLVTFNWDTLGHALLATSTILRTEVSARIAYLTNLKRRNTIRCWVPAHSHRIGIIRRTESLFMDLVGNQVIGKISLKSSSCLLLTQKLRDCHTCSFSNFAYRYVCKNCSAAKPVSHLSVGNPLIYGHPPYDVPFPMYGSSRSYPLDYHRGMGPPR